MSFEKPGTENLEKFESIKELEHFIKGAAERCRNESVPLSNDGSIDMLAYMDIYPGHVEDDLRKVREGKTNAKDIHEEQLGRDGEKLEMLAYAIFAKNLGENFVVARSAPHDDKINGVDTILLDRKTGKLVCAFDEVGDTTGSVYNDKLEKVQRCNRDGGAHLKYGLGLDEEKKIKLMNVRNVPLFYIALPKDRINKGIAEFIPEAERQSDFEKKLFAYFTATITQQISGLELYGKLHPELKEKLSAFKNMVSALEKKPEKGK